MNSRTPTKAEQRYGDLCVNIIGCMPCRFEKLPMFAPNGSWIPFHHDPDYGSKKPGCHFHAFGLCVGHHQGKKGFNLPARHKNQSRFAQRYGSDEFLCKATWKMISVLPGDIQRGIMEFCPFEELKEAA